MAIRTIRVGGNGKKRWSGRLSRLQEQVKNNLGIIMTDQMSRNQQYRDDKLEQLDAYYEGRQYDDLQEWDSTQTADQEYISVRKRKPRVMYNLAKVIVDKVASKICGSDMFPKFIVEDDPDDTEFFRVVQKASNFRRQLLEPIKHTLKSGSCFVRFYLVDGAPCIEHYNSKYCYPVFDAVNELESIDIRYVYDDLVDLDGQGFPTKKWFRMTLSKTVDVLFDNPKFQAGAGLPKFTPVEETAHNLGWVQGEWFRTSQQKHTPDGYGLYAEILPFIDDLNYSLSQTSQAVSYNQEPQLGVNGMDVDELDDLIKSSQKAWNLGREGKAAFIESDMGGVIAAKDIRAETRQRAFDVVRVILHDPEKMVANAQSGKAMEVLHGPLVELVDELRTTLEPSFRNLLVKLGLTLLEVNDRGEEIVLDVPAGYVPESIDITVQWPAVFPLTLEDLGKKAALVVSLSNANLISRETGTAYIAPDLNIENVEEEAAKIAAQPVINPFGGGFGGGF